MFFTNLGSSLILYSPESESLTGATFSAVPVTAFGLNGTVVGTSAGGVENGTLNGSATIKTVLGISTTTLNGTLSGGGAVINFTAASNSGDWNTASSLATVKGSYTATFSVGGTSYAPALTIDGNGNITGSDTTAKDGNGVLCAYTGNVAVHDITHNDYNVTLNSTCLSGSTFTGIAAFFPAGLSNPGGILGKAALKTGLTDGNSTGIYLNLTQ